MRAYIIKAENGGQVFGIRYAGTAASAKTARDELVATFELKKKDVTIGDCEIPTQKQALLDFVNEISAKSDFVAEEEDE